MGSRDNAPQSLIVDGVQVFLEIAKYRLSPAAAPSEQLIVIFLLSIVLRVLPCRRIREKIIANNKFLSAISKAQLVCDSFAGDSFSDIYGLGRFLLAAIARFVVILLKKRLLFLPQTYGPFRNRLGRLIASNILSRAERIMARDTHSVEVARSMIGHARKNPPVDFCPDVAFVLDSTQPVGKLAVWLDANESGILGLNVSGLLYNGGYNRRNMFGLSLDYRTFVQELSARVLRETGMKLLIIPHTYAPLGSVESDPEACRLVYDVLTPDYLDRAFLVEGKKNQYELKGIIGLCDFFVGSRLHSCIAALSQCVPTVGVAYSPKFRGVFDTVGASDCVIEGRTTETQCAICTTLQLVEARERMRFKLQQRVPHVQATIRNSLRTAFKLK